MSMPDSGMPSSDKSLDLNFWNARYQAHTTGWDLGEVSFPIKLHIDQLQDRDCAILIPGCGNAYEAEYLLEKGFNNITVLDIAPILVEHLQKKLAGKDQIKIIQGDFFEHSGSYDLIIEQTFFCALLPSLRSKYVTKMHKLLSDGGKLVGLLFNGVFEAGPPFGGSQQEYEQLFKETFSLERLEICNNSATKRQNQELWFEFCKKS